MSFDAGKLVTAVTILVTAGAVRADEDAPTGKLSWNAAPAKRFEVLHDPYRYASNAELNVRQFPAAAVAWTVDGDIVLPVDQVVTSTGHPGWDISFQPGRVKRDGESVREPLHESVRESLGISLPFALLEKGANCTHNGILDVVLERGAVTGSSYRIESETCAYFKFDMTGVLDARFTADVPDDDVVRAGRRHREARLPVLPVEQLGDDYPGFDLSAFDVLRAKDLSVYGFVIDGKHYRSTCRTRGGDYDFCDELLLPSYSTAKSIFAALALMRLEVLVPGASDARIADLADDGGHCRNWGDVSIGHALDMATGRYASAAADVDEASPAHVAFLYSPTHAARIGFACGHFPRKAPAGTRFVYHSSDTYLAGTAMRALLKRNRLPDDRLYETLVVDPFWTPLSLSAAIHGTLVTRDEEEQPFTGWGLFYTSDDIARIAVWLNDGAPGLADLDRDMLERALQRVPDDRGLLAGDGLRYKYGFWSWDAGPALGCEGPVHVPFMSGYGGIAVVLFPNGTVYYYFSDGYQQRWREVAVESHKLRSLCK